MSPAAAAVHDEQEQLLLYPRYQSLEALQAAAAGTSASKKRKAEGDEDAAKKVDGASKPAGGAGGVAGADQSAAAGEEVPVGADGRPLTKLEIKRLKRAARRPKPPAGEEKGAEGDKSAAPAGASDVGPTPHHSEGKNEAKKVKEVPGAVVTASDGPTATKKKSSGDANLEEAQRIREALGYAPATAAGVATAAAADKCKADGDGGDKEEDKEGKKEKKSKKEKKRKSDGNASTSGKAVVEEAGAPTVEVPAPTVAAGVANSGAKAGFGSAAGSAVGGKSFAFGFKVAQAAAAAEAEAEAKIARIMMVDSATKDGLVPRRVGGQ